MTVQTKLLIETKKHVVYAHVLFITGASCVSSNYLLRQWSFSFSSCTMTFRGLPQGSQSGPSFAKADTVGMHSYDHIPDNLLQVINSGAW